ncbi:hypothetical protein [Sphingomonas sp. UYP23]
MIKFLWLKELHRLPPLPPGQTSPQRRYLTTNTNAAQRLRALGQIVSQSIAAAASKCERSSEKFFAVLRWAQMVQNAGRVDAQLQRVR